jgi:hypothetical protein
MATCITCKGDAGEFPARVYSFETRTDSGPFCDRCAPFATGYKTKDSGARRSWDTGSQRDDATGKGRYDLLPREAIHRLAQLYERGAAKYDDRNWEKGQPLSVIANSMLRHAFQAAAGLEDEDHLAAVAWNAFALITIRERIAAGTLPAELDDLPRAA